MRAMTLTAPGRLEGVEAATPALRADGQVLVKVERVGICGSDMHYYHTGRIGPQQITYPFRIGHECSGTVAEVAGGVDRVGVGDEVAVDPAMPCGRCDQCCAGREHTCRNLRFLGCPDQAQGCLCEYLVMPQESLYPTDGRLSLDQAMLIEPLSIGVYAVELAGLKAVDAVAILGAGPIGLCVLAVAAARGAGQVWMTEIVPERLAIARSAGARWTGNPDTTEVVYRILELHPGGVDVAFECAGRQETIDQAIDLLKPGGKLVLVGIPETDSIALPIHRCRRREITIINVRRQNRCVVPAIDLVAGGKVHIDHLITHTFSLGQTPQAFDLVAHYRDGVVKAMIKP